MRLLGIAICCGLFLSTACKGNSNPKADPAATAKLPPAVQQWVSKLDSPDHVGKALTALEKLNNPVAIPALIKGWKKRSGDGQFLRAILQLAHNTEQHTVVASAIPFLATLASSVRVPKPPSKRVDQAVHAIRALRDVKSTLVHATLVDVCGYPAKSSYGQRATIVACLALADRTGDASHRALVVALERGARTRSPRVSAAAARALGKRGDKRALGPLAKSMYVAPKAFPSLREAIVAMGPDAVIRMMAIFAGTDADLNEMASKVKLTRPQMMRQAALMLGDLYHKPAVPQLIASLKQPGIHHEAVFIALTQIADPSAAPAVLAYALNKKNDKAQRVSAIGAYGVLAPNAKQLPTLLARLRGEKDVELRNILSLTCAQLVRTPRQLVRLTQALPKKQKVSTAAQAVASVGALCGTDGDCYLRQVESLPKQLHTRISKLKGLTLSAKQVAQIKPFVDVRSLTDVVKLSRTKKPPLTTLLRLLATASMAVHQQVLYALVHTAGRPCNKCLTRLDALLARKKRVPAQVTQGLRMIRSYLSWAK